MWCVSDVYGCARANGRSGKITVIIISVKLSLSFFPGNMTRFGRYFDFRRRDRRIFDVMFTSLVESDLSAIHFHVYQIKLDVTIS